MLKQDLHIKEPCAANWNEMAGDGAVRFCGRCEKSVHGLSDMTRRQAEAILDAAQDRKLCVRYFFDAQGRVQFPGKMVAASSPVPQRAGAGRMLAAGAALVASLLSGGFVNNAFAQDAAYNSSANAPDASVEERIFAQERQAVKTLQAYGLELEEEYITETPAPDAQLYLVINPPDLYDHEVVGGGL
jgi:hypothetical protein